MQARYWIGTGLVALSVVGFVAGCGGGGTSSTGGSNPSTSTVAAGNAQNGMQIFQKNCSSCHSSGSNTVVGPGLATVYQKSTLPNGQKVTDDNVANWIRTGGGGMPGFPQLSDQDRADLVAYIKSLK